MTALENYSKIINSIFGIGSTTFDVSKETTNNVIGALNHPTEYNEFKKNFTERLKRLKNIYTGNPKQFKEIIVQANLIGDNKNWEGAYAELSAYDLLNNSPLLVNAIEPNIDVDKNKTFASELGKSESNLDGFISDCAVYFDVKCLKDNVTDILRGIYTEIEKELGIKNLHISEEYALDISYDEFQNNRQKLKSELQTKLWDVLQYKVSKFAAKYNMKISCDNFKDTIKALPVNLKQELLNEIYSIKTSCIHSGIITNLSYKILWNKGILTTMRSYHPFRHALNYHSLLFNYANKFIKNKPTLIVLVTFPWYNQVISNFGDGNKLLYRSLARRVFCQYINSNQDFKSFNPKFKGKETIFEITKNLSGIIFIEDDCILSKNSNSINVNAYAYLNPNANNPLKGMAIDYIHSLNIIDFDDYEYDNY